MIDKGGEGFVIGFIILFIILVIGRSIATEIEMRNHITDVCEAFKVSNAVQIDHPKTKNEKLWSMCGKYSGYSE
jgi:hypothetical protein